MAEAILWAMEMHPDDRPQSVAEFADVLFGHHARAHPARPATLASALRENRTAALLALGLVLLAVVLTLL